jgi:hypothetical protein
MKLAYEHLVTVLATLSMAGCAKPAAPEKLEKEPASQPSAAASPADAPVPQAPRAAVGSKEVPSALPSASASPAGKGGKEKGCAPGGCAPGACG